MAKKAVTATNKSAPAVVSMSNLDPDIQYRVRLMRPAKHGNDLLRPRDSHMMLGSAVKDLVPQEAIESIEKVG